ncbi:MAG TPA: glycosyltransferase family 2 protein [Thermoleophilaceae bacterium]|nr:glycosyltransferase family 2 protein [Thermoleophilaceae bacterium]
MADLAIIVVSIPDEPDWLPPCLESVAVAARGIEAEVVVVDNGETGSAAALVERDYPWATAVRCENRGFGHANNRGLERTSAPDVLFLNPDTEVREGDFGALLAARDPDVGVAGVRQVLPDGSVYPTSRRFPGPGRVLLPERTPLLGPLLGERELRMERYDDEFDCDWVIGSFMLCRRAAIGDGFDERFFLYSEETDLCLRARLAGYRVTHLPVMTIVHHLHAGQALAPRMEAQQAWARVQYGRKHFGPARRAAFEAALRLRYRLRRGERARLVLDTVSGRREPPFAHLQV